MTDSPRLGFRSARCARRLRAVGWDLMRIHDSGLPDVWVASRGPVVVVRPADVQHAMACT